MHWVNDLVLSLEVNLQVAAPGLEVGYHLHLMGSGFISITSYWINSILNYIKLYIVYIYIHITNIYNIYIHITNLWAIAAIAIPSWYSVRRSCFSRVLNQHAQPRLRTGWRGRCCQQSPALSAVGRFCSHLLKTRLTGTGCHWLWQPLVFWFKYAQNLSSFLDCCWWYQFFLVRIICLDEFSVFHQLSLVKTFHHWSAIPTSIGRIAGFRYETVVFLVEALMEQVAAAEMAVTQPSPWDMGRKQPWYTMVTLWLWLTVRHGKSPFFIGKPSISIRAICTMANC